MNSQQRENAITLASTRAVSWRGIGRALRVPKSTVSDFLRKREQQEFARILEKLSRSV